VWAIVKVCGSGEYTQVGVAETSEEASRMREQAMADAKGAPHMVCPLPGQKTTPPVRMPSPAEIEATLRAVRLRRQRRDERLQAGEGDDGRVRVVRTLTGAQTRAMRTYLSECRASRMAPTLDGARLACDARVSEATFALFVRRFAEQTSKPGRFGR